MSDDPLFDGDDKANTPLAPEERDGLIPTKKRPIIKCIDFVLHL
jgi:hypothetical protein